MIRHVELSGSRSGTDATDKSSSATLAWRLWGTTSVDAARDYLTTEDVVPSIYDGLVYKSLEWEHDGAGVWIFTASYQHPDKSDERQSLETGEYVFSFDTSGQTVTRKVSLGTTAYAKSGETAPDFKGAIGVERDKSEQRVEGVEVGVSGLKFSITKRMPRTDITLAYIRVLKSLTYTKNNAAFLGFDAGELLFVGATGREGTNTDPEVTFNFIASDNVDNLTVGDITGIVKPGHDYLWQLFEEVEDSSANATVTQPKAAYVEQVYYEGDHTKLSI
jgi:hypothetical protein